MQCAGLWWAAVIILTVAKTHHLPSTVPSPPPNPARIVWTWLLFPAACSPRDLEP